MATDARARRGKTWYIDEAAPARCPCARCRAIRDCFAARRDGNDRDEGRFPAFALALVVLAAIAASVAALAALATVAVLQRLSDAIPR